MSPARTEAQKRADEYDRIHRLSSARNPTMGYRPQTMTYQPSRNPPPAGGVLCYDAASGTLRGSPSSPYFGLPVELVDLYADSQTVRVRHASFPDREIVVALCPDAEIDDFRATPMPTDHPRCCVDLQTMTLVCEDPSFRLHGATVTEILAEQPDGLLSVSLVDPADGVTKNGRFERCQQPPQQCCYDVASGTLRCETSNGLDGAAVSLISMDPQPDGSVHALVQNSDVLGTPDTVSFPVCDDPVTDCCYDPTTEKLVCPGTDLDGTAAGIVAAWTGNDGQIYVWAAWRGGGARMPLCPGTQECPPVFCCVNMQTMAFVCPGRPEINGQTATLSEIATDDGYSWGVLDDGTRVPLCGKECPPPRLCPECPTCPPGQWMSPDGSCAPPATQDPCPPGARLEPGSGCVPCRQANPCCDGCAKGHGCEGDEHAPEQANPRATFRRITPILQQRNAGRRRKRRIFSGNR